MTEVITKHLDVWTSALMNKSTAGRGSNAKQTAYGIKKLRDLILELAVRGKLVPQDPNDEPASELLKKIAIKKKNLIEKGIFNKQSPTVDINDEEKYLVLPNGWEWIRLCDIAYSQAGFAFKSNSFNETGDGLPLIRIRDVGQDFTGTYYSGEYRDEFVVNNGDYLISMDGQFRVATWHNGQALLNQRVSRLIFYDEKIGQRYVADSLQARLLELQGIKAYTTVDHLSGSQISHSIIALPPLAEQHRIVAKVDELMALCDQLEQQQTDSNAVHQTLVETLLGTLTNTTVRAVLVKARPSTDSGRTEFEEAWKRIAEHFDTLFTTEHSIEQLKQTILQLAVMGKLVPQEPDDEPASVLLEKIAEEKALLVKSGKLKTQTSASEINLDELTTLPEKWQWCYLTDLLALVTDGDHQAPPKSNSGIPFLVIGNLNTRKINFDNCNFVPDEYFQKLDWSRQPTKGDILYTVTGSYGIPIPVDSSEDFCVQRHVAILKSSISTPKKYLTLVLESKFSFDFATEIATGIAQKTVPITGLRKMPIPLAPENEQHRIVAKVEELMALCDALNARINQAQTTQIHLADAIVEQAVA